MKRRDLEEAYAITQKIVDLRERQVRLRASVEGTTSQITDMPGTKGPSTDKFAKYVEKAIRLDRRLTLQILALEELRQESEEWLLTLPIGHRQIIDLRYFKGLSWEAVAEECSYSLSQVYRVNREVINTLH